MSACRRTTTGIQVQHVLDYVKRTQAENPSFFYAIYGDEDHSVGSIFWVDAASRMNYSYFGDTVVFHTDYRSKNYKLPFYAFTGLNHHAQPVLFGCGLTFSQSEASFVWLFQTLVRAMPARHLASITTHPDGLIQSSVAQVFPRTRHRFCKWAIFRESQDKLCQVYESNPSFEMEFRKCVSESQTVSEFESSWRELIGKYYLIDNEWLQSLYHVRQQWVPVYMQDIFFGDLCRTEGSDGRIAFFDGYVDSSTSMQMLVRQIENAITSWHERELEADYDTASTKPILRTPSPMEKQAASLYTKEIFTKFQEELVATLANSATKMDESGCFTTYRVAKFGKDHKVHKVIFNAVESKASCSCQMFESCGIICRHILAVFRVKNVLTLPFDYILKRWTRNAKADSIAKEVVYEVPNNCKESPNAWYDNLHCEAMKYVEEGAKSVHSYNVSMEALQVAVKKVADMMGQPDPDCSFHGSFQDLLSGNEPQVASTRSLEEKREKFRVLKAELDDTNRRCEIYRDHLLAVVRHTEDHKLKFSVKVENAKLNLKECAIKFTYC